MRKRIGLCQIRLVSAKTNISLRLKVFFFRENDVKFAKTRCFALKTRFMHIIGFTAMKTLGNVQTH